MYIIRSLLYQYNVFSRPAAHVLPWSPGISDIGPMWHPTFKEKLPGIRHQTAPEASKFASAFAAAAAAVAAATAAPGGPGQATAEPGCEARNWSRSFETCTLLHHHDPLATQRGKASGPLPRVCELLFFWNVNGHCSLSSPRRGKDLLMSKACSGEQGSFRFCLSWRAHIPFSFPRAPTAASRHNAIHPNLCNEPCFSLRPASGRADPAVTYSTCFS